MTFHCNKASPYLAIGSHLSFPKHTTSSMLSFVTHSSYQLPKCYPSLFGDCAPFKSQLDLVFSVPHSHCPLLHGQSPSPPVSELGSPGSAGVAFMAVCRDAFSGPLAPWLQVPGEQGMSPVHLWPSSASHSQYNLTPVGAPWLEGQREKGRKLFSNSVLNLHRKAGPLPFDFCQ